MVFWIMKEVQEPEKWKQQAKMKRPGMIESFGRLFTPEYQKRTIVMSTLFLVSIIGLWAGSVYVPTAVTQIAQRPEYGYSPADTARLASYASGLLAIATIIGCLAAPGIAERLGRKPTMALYFTIMMIGIALGFGYVFYLPSALPLFFACIVILGIGGANFAMYTLWIPEQYTTDCRGSAIGFISSIGRFVGVAMVFLVGEGIASYGSLGVPVALTAVAFIVGLLAIPAAEETRGKPLPA
jgi:MFS family permease